MVAPDAKMSTALLPKSATYRLPLESNASGPWSLLTEPKLKPVSVANGVVALGAYSVTVPLPEFATYRLPEESKASAKGFASDASVIVAIGSVPEPGANSAITLLTASAANKWPLESMSSAKMLCRPAEVLKVAIGIVPPGEFEHSARGVPHEQVAAGIEQQRTRVLNAVSVGENHGGRGCPARIR